MVGYLYKCEKLSIESIGQKNVRDCMKLYDYSMLALAKNKQEIIANKISENMYWEYCTITRGRVYFTELKIISKLYKEVKIYCDNKKQLTRLPSTTRTAY
jgi:hypothetical protein